MAEQAAQQGQDAGAGDPGEDPGDAEGMDLESARTFMRIKRDAFDSETERIKAWAFAMGRMPEHDVNTIEARSQIADCLARYAEADYGLPTIEE